jgi:hypothetical protein
VVDVDQCRVEHVADVSVGGWIAPRLGPFGGWVGSVAPRDYPEYARVLHPARDAQDHPTRWADVCAATGQRPHPLMQWHAIARMTQAQVEIRSTALTERMLWPGVEPTVGNLEPDALRALCEVLGRYTAHDQGCLFALWEGWGWNHGGPRLRHPGRDYLLFTGPLPAALDFGDSRGIWSQSPNLFWPSDRSWFVATEIDFDSTIVAGGAELIAAILADPTLEAWRVDPDDSLAHDGDTINT